MKITAAHMGDLHITLTALFNRLGIEYVAPPPITEKTYEIGFKLSPEQVCLPFKICVGNYVEAIEKGADTIVMAGGNGPCRFGFYGVLQEKILKDAGFSARMLVLNQDNIREVFRELFELTGIKSKFQMFSAFYFAWKVLRMSEKNDRLAARYRAHTTQKREVEAIYRRVQSILPRLKTFKEAERFGGQIENYYKYGIKLDIDPREVLNVGILGEIYMVLDGRANMNIEKSLGDMNIWAHRTIYLSEWLLRLISCDFFSKRSHRAMKKIARPYLSSDVGGKGVQTIASAIMFADEKKDGLVHITPFSCMPEIVATTILPRVCSDRAIPCLYLTFDEHTSRAAVQTRLEAFADMLKMKRSA